MKRTKKQRREKIIWIVLSLILFFFNVDFTSALMGVSPSRVEIEDVLAGGYAEREFTISSAEIDGVNIKVEFTGEISEWLSVDNEDVFTKLGRPHKLKLMINPSENVIDGTYESNMILRLVSFESTDGASSSISASLVVPIKVKVTSFEIIYCTSGALEIASVEKEDDIVLNFKIKNLGNSQFQPTIDYKIYDQDRIVILKEDEIFDPEFVKPDVEARKIYAVKHELSPNQYWVELNVCDTKLTETFSILEKGEIADQGEFLRLEHSEEILEDEIIPVTAVFKNKGIRPVETVFVGKLIKDGKIVEVIETEPIVVEIFDSAPILTYIEIDDPGSYELEGKILYNKKVTKEIKTTINVEDSGVIEGSDFGAILILIIIIVIMLIVFMIHRKEKQRRKFKKRKRVNRKKGD